MPYSIDCLWTYTSQETVVFWLMSVSCTTHLLLMQQAFQEAVMSSGACDMPQVSSTASATLSAVCRQLTLAVILPGGWLGWLGSYNISCEVIFLYHIPSLNLLWMTEHIHDFVIRNPIILQCHFILWINGVFSKLISWIWLCRLWMVYSLKLYSWYFVINDFQLIGQYLYRITEYIVINYHCLFVYISYFCCHSFQNVKPG